MNGNGEKMKWFIENLGTLIVCVVLVAGVVLAIVRMVKNKKRGETCCSRGCSSCPMNGKCDKE